jgi:hypothetical protein
LIPPTHGISNPYPWYIDPLSMVFWSLYPWYFDPSTHGILNPLPMVYWHPTHGILNPLPMVFLPPYSREDLTTSGTYPWSFDHIFSIAINQVMVAIVKLSKWWLQLSQYKPLVQSLSC